MYSLLHPCLRRPVVNLFLSFSFSGSLFPSPALFFLFPCDSDSGEQRHRTAFPLRSRSPCTCTLHWWEHLFSPKRRMPCFPPVPSPGAPTLHNQRVGQYARRLTSRKPGKAREGKENELTPCESRNRELQRKWERASSPKAAMSRGPCSPPRCAPYLPPRPG